MVDHRVGIGSQLGHRLGEARQRYGAFVREGIGEGSREELHRGSEDPRVSGDEDFVEEDLSDLDQWADSIGSVSHCGLAGHLRGHPIVSLSSRKFLASIFQ